MPSGSFSRIVCPGYRDESEELQSEADEGRHAPEHPMPGFPGLSAISQNTSGTLRTRPVTTSYTRGDDRGARR